MFRTPFTKHGIRYFSLYLLELRSRRAQNAVGWALKYGFEFEVSSQNFAEPSWQRPRRQDDKPEQGELRKMRDFDDGILRLSTLNADLGFIEMGLTMLLRHLKKFNTLIETFGQKEMVFAVTTSKDDGNTRIHVRETDRILQHDADYLGGLSESCLERVRQIKQKVEIQLVAVQNFIAQRDNRINRDDSFSMKTLSIMSMALLPGTFVASFFAMPFFSFGTDQVVNGHFWIYWAVTLPFTVVVFTGWIGLLWWNKIHPSKKTSSEDKV